jgi:Zn-dependent protease
LELFGTILVPAVLLLTASPFLFGWAKPVPVAFNRVSNPRRDMALVAFAGPAVNVLLAVVSAVLFHVLGWLPREAVGREGPGRRALLGGGFPSGNKRYRQ